MSGKQHRVARYAYALEAGTGFGRLSLWDADGNAIGDIGFIDDSRSVPDAKFAKDLSYGIGFLPASRMTALVDMLRHEEDVYLTLDNEVPGVLSVHTLSRQKHV